MTHSKSRLPYHLLFIVVCFTLSVACKKDENPNVLDGCCDTPAINAIVGSGHVYVPNVFTPNDDGINDMLIPYGDQNIKLFRSYRVSDKDGITVFSFENGSPNDADNRWDGRVDNEYINGIYSIAMEVEAIDGTILSLQGKVCNFRCLDMEVPEPISGTGCQFPSQVEDGAYNPLYPSGENSGCFE